jgi:hypothetical protein
LIPVPVAVAFSFVELLELLPAEWLPVVYRLELLLQEL